MAKGYKIKRYSNIYRRHPRRRFTRAIQVILVVAVLFAVGWAVYQPVYDLLFPAGGEASSQPAEPSSSLPEESSAPAAEEPEEPVVLPQSAGGQMVYLPTEILADTASLPALLESLQAGGMQEILIDLKDAEGLVLYQSQVEAAASSLDPQYDLAQVTAAAQAAGVRVAGRLWAFQDRMAATVLYDSCVKYNDTTFNWLDNDAEDGGKPWLNPYDSEAQQYLLDLMEEAMGLGVQDIVLAGVQFPSGISLSAANYGPEEENTPRAQVLYDFVARARELAAQQEGSCWYQVAASDLLAPSTDPLSIYGGSVATATGDHPLLVDVTPQNLTQETVAALALDAQQQADPVQVIAAQLAALGQQGVTPYLDLDSLSGEGGTLLEQLSQDQTWTACDGYVLAGQELLGE